MFLVEVSREPNSGVVQNIKRIIDILISILILIITLPLSIGVILVIKLDSQGNVLYKQKRVGEKEKIFTIYKFRTMSANAEEKTGLFLP